MKNVIFKKFWLAVFTFFLVAASLEVSAQATEDNAPNASNAIAQDYGVSAYAYGTFDADNAFLTLNDEMNSMKSSGETKEYKYYWLVAVDAKRFEVPVEDALLQNLAKIQQEFGTNVTALQALYNNTVIMLQ